MQLKILPNSMGFNVRFARFAVFVAVCFLIFRNAITVLFFDFFFVYQTKPLVSIIIYIYR